MSSGRVCSIVLLYFAKLTHACMDKTPPSPLFIHSFMLLKTYSFYCLLGNIGNVRLRLSKIRLNICGVENCSGRTRRQAEDRQMVTWK